MNTILKPEYITDNFYKIKIKNINNYDQKSLQEELESPRIKRLLETGSLKCELFSKKIYEKFTSISNIINFTTIDIINTCATIKEIKDDYIIIEVSPLFKKLMMKIFINDNISIYANIRAICKHTNNKYEIFRLITFDIIYDEIKEDKI